MKDSQNPETASIEVAMLHGHQVDPETVGDGTLQYLDTEQNDWGFYVPDEDYLQSVAETIFLLEQEGIDTTAFLTVDDTYPQKSELASEEDFRDTLADGVVNQYMETITENAGDIDSEVIGSNYDTEDAVKPDTYVWESEVGQATLEEILENENIPEWDNPGPVGGKPETWGIAWKPNGKEAKLYSMNQEAGPGLKAKVVNQHSPEEFDDQTKVYDFTCPLSHVGYALEMTGEADNTEIPSGDLGVSFTQNWNSFSSGGYGPSTSDKADFLMNILEGPAGEEDKSGPYDFSNHQTFDAPYTDGLEVLDKIHQQPEQVN